MKHAFGKTVVISLGGSVVCPDGVNAKFVEGFKRLVEGCSKKGIKFLLIVGGGGVCRVYQRAAKGLGKVTDADGDWIGIYATRLNATLIRAVFGKRAAPELIEKRGQVKKLSHPVTVGAGWRPGWSTDFVTTALAHDFGAKEVINIGKPPFVYDKNPDEHKDAAPIREMQWKEYCAKMPKKWSPGLHAPVDPVAARFCAKNGIMMFVVGADLKNLTSLLEGEEFEGTVIR
ncbi:MAG: UMP kinase [Candidatus Liptonbacteria bacterium]|nr:UMP kinase [Candidatus Liptonbacteria bacterium]